MLRLTAFIALTALPASAWEFEVRDVCLLTHRMDAADIEVSYDPSIPEYAIRITRTPPWPGGPVFAIRFDGPRGLTISTDRHELSAGQATLTVTDKGFGNVLNGLQFNRTATAILGDEALSISLDGAAEPVEAFRACTEARLS